MRLLGLLLTGLALAACVAVEEPAPVESQPAAPATPELGADAIPTTTPDLPPLPADKPAVPSEPSVPLEDLVGAGDTDVLALLGEPELTEDRAPGVAWIYEGTDCRFGLLLYPDLETNRLTVLSVETSGESGCAARIATP